MVLADTVVETYLINIYNSLCTVIVSVLTMYVSGGCYLR